MTEEKRLRNRTRTYRWRSKYPDKYREYQKLLMRNRRIATRKLSSPVSNDNIQPVQ